MFYYKKVIYEKELMLVEHWKSSIKNPTFPNNFLQPHRNACNFAIAFSTSRGKT